MPITETLPDSVDPAENGVWRGQHLGKRRTINRFWDIGGLVAALQTLCKLVIDFDLPRLGAGEEIGFTS
jgi:hypothetical protein